MKADPVIKGRVVENIREDLQKTMKTLEDILELMEKAETVEEFMSLKRELLIEYLKGTPIGASHCYFCELIFSNDKDCCDCPYAKHHSACMPVPNYNQLVNECVSKIMDLKVSDFGKISIAKCVLIELIDRLYYKGEEYEEEDV